VLKHIREPLESEERCLYHINSRAKELGRGVKVLTFGRMIDSVNLMIRELENIARSNHL